MASLIFFTFFYSGDIIDSYKEVMSMKNPLKLLEELFYPMADRCPICSAECACGICDACANELNGIKCNDGTSLYFYAGKARHIVHRFKFSGERYLCDAVSEMMLPLMKETDVITNVPVHIKRCRKRGFDQSALIAEALAKKCEMTYKPLLKKIVDTPPQSMLTKEERYINVKDNYSVSEDVEGLRILLVDDVITTGATISECTEMLKKAGAAGVEMISFCKTEHSAFSRDGKDDIITKK